MPKQLFLKNTSGDHVWIPAGIKPPPTGGAAAKAGLSNPTMGLLEPGEEVKVTDTQASVALQHDQKRLQLIER